MAVNPTNNPIEQEALRRRLDNQFELINSNLEKLKDEELDLEWGEDEEDIWAYRKSFD